MDGLDEILRAEKQAAELKKDAAGKAALILSTAESYRDRKLAEALSMSGVKVRELIHKAEEQAEAKVVKMKAEAEVKAQLIRSAAEAKLDTAAAYIAERIAEV